MVVIDVLYYVNVAALNLLALALVFRVSAAAAAIAPDRKFVTLARDHGRFLTAREPQRKPLLSPRRADNRGGVSEEGVDSERMPPAFQEGGFLRGVRETLAYIKAPDAFIASRSGELGPVFRTNMFFRPTVVVGGADNVAEFIRKEGQISRSSLPDTFTELHTPIGLLNLSGDAHTAQRRGVMGVLDPSSLERYISTVDARMRGFVRGLLAGGNDDGVPLAAALKRECLDLFAELFTGDILDDELADAFEAYNTGLLALGKWSGTFRKGRKALDKLRGAMLGRIAAARADLAQAESVGRPADPRFESLRQLMSSVDEHGEPWDDERTATAAVLLVWGAYIEAASLMAKATAELATRPDVVATIRDEMSAAGIVLPLKGPSDAQQQAAPLASWELPYTMGVLRETLRLNPPAGGGFRLAEADIDIGDYTIPAGHVVTADPRITSWDPALFPNPEVYEPLRWVSSASSTAAGDDAQSRCPFAGHALSLPLGGWFPGGIGKHQCPGIPLAELVAKVYVAHLVSSASSWEETAPSDDVLVPIRIPSDSWTVKFEAAF